MARITIDELRLMKESEDHVEFKKGEHGNIAYDGGTKCKPADRRRCILGYVIALCNEGGGRLVIGMEDKYPHKVVGTKQNEGSLGQLEADIYRDCGIRPQIYELYEDEQNKTGRVLVIEVQGRPAGKMFKFEDVALMRVGEELRPMSDEKYRQIIHEQEPDFSEEICPNVSLSDLDKDAILVMKQQYAKKQKNPLFESLSDQQALSDLGLIVDRKVTNAAILLVGKETTLNKVFPQAKIMLEYRGTESQIPYDNRKEYHKPFYLMIDELWRDINLRNGSVPVQESAYIFDIPFFNEEVIREALNNAIAHRDYRRNSEIVIKQYPQRLTIINAGGFPIGVTIDNLLTVPSTPRNRLLADVLSKTGIVERSGQGVDKIFMNTLSEGKPMPDYSQSDSFKVELSLSAIIESKAFAIFIKSTQDSLNEDNKLSVQEVLTLNQILKKTDRGLLDKNIVKKLEQRRLIEKRGKTSAMYYILSREYYEFTDNMAEYSLQTDWNLRQAWPIICEYLTRYGKAKMSDFVQLLGSHLSKKQIRNIIDEMCNNNYLKVEGQKRGTTYYIGEAYKKDSELINKAIHIGMQELKKRGEI